MDPALLQFLRRLLEQAETEGQYGPPPQAPQSAMPGVPTGPPPRVPVQGRRNVAGAQGNRENTPPRTGTLPNGKPFPGKAEPKQRYFPTGYNDPRLPKPSTTTPPTPGPDAWNIKNQPATPRPTRPPATGTPITGAGPKGVRYPIQAAKRIQQAATKPPIANRPITPGVRSTFGPKR
jgi:hypothetical protein